MSIKEHVTGKAVFQFYRAGNLYYKTDSGLEFSVPISDTNEATFNSEDKAIFFMRWIRKHLDTLKSNLEVNSNRKVEVVDSNGNTIGIQG